MEHILIAEDDEVQGQLLVTLFKSNGYDTIYTQNGKEALDAFKANPNVILVTDIHMPIMSGDELIKNVKQIDEDALIIVQTSNTKPEDIIQIMKLGVYDYLIKPIDKSEFILKMKRVSEAFDLRKLKKNIDKEKFARLENQLEWYQYKDKNNNSNEIHNKSDIHYALFHNLKQNFSQGAGIGVLSSMIDLFDILPKNEKGDYTIGSNIVELFRSNNAVIRKALNNFEEIEKLIYKDIQLEKINCEDLFKLVDEVKIQAFKYLEIKSNEIIISEFKPKLKKYNAMVNKNLLSRVIFELIINALKFSKDHSKILILVDIMNDNLIFTFINDAEKDQKSRIGIPEEYQNLIFEPFFRLSAYVNEKYDTLDYGLGLTFVEKVILRHKGKIKVNNIKFHSTSEVTIEKVEISILIPIISNL